MPFSRSNFTGFPFDRDLDRDRDGSFRTKLDDIAKRHPEFAEHLQSFPLRSGSRRQHSTDDPEFFSRFERPFGSSFNRFGFPFDRDEFDGNPHTQYHPQPSADYYPPDPPQPQYYKPQQEEQPQSSQQNQSTSQNCNCSHSKPQEQERGRSKNIQQSNTVDLGQKQEPVNERSPRSMSAPPSDGRQGQRFVSSINIPIQRENEDGINSNMGKQYSTHPQQPQPQTPQSGAAERVIPIHVEGRDVPIIPKNVHHIPQSQPQPERIFGQRPEQFTQFVREPRQFSSDWHHPAFEAKHGEEFIRKQHVPQQTAAPQQHRAKSPPPQHQERQKSPQPQQQRQKSPQPQQSGSPQPQQQPPKPQPPSPIEQIQNIQKDVSSLMRQVEQFKGAPKDKHYLYLDEMLTRNLLKLDNIDTQGQENIRNARREAVKCIEKCIGVLEAKAAANVAPKEEAKTEEKMEIEEKASQDGNVEAKKEEEKMEEEPLVNDNRSEATGKSGSEEKEKPEQQVMEVVAEDKKEPAKVEEVNVEEVASDAPKIEETPITEESAKAAESNTKVEDAAPKPESKDPKEEVSEKPSVEGKSEEESKEEGKPQEEVNKEEENKDAVKGEDEKTEVKKEKKKTKKKVEKKQ